jgi:hypothetical protein
MVSVPEVSEASPGYRANPRGGGVIKRIIVIAAALLMLASVSTATATASSASVCEPNGMGCTPAGTYPGPNALVNSNYGGFKLVWTKSVVQPYSSGVPLYWTVWVTYTNMDSSALTLSCPEDVTNLSAVQEHMSGGSGDDGTVGGYSTTCSDDPGWTADVPPGGTAQVYTTFHNVPWPGSAVAITWYTAGTTEYVYPFQTTSPAPRPQPTIHWSRTSARPGTHVTLTGNGWVPGGTVNVHLPSKGFFIGNASWHVSSNGSWKQNFTVADTKPGAHTLRFTESSGNLHVSGSFKVLPVPNAGQDWARCHDGSCTIALDHARTDVLIDILNGTPKAVILPQLFALCNAYTYGLIRVACSIFAAGAVLVDAPLLARQLSDSDLGRGVYITYLTIHFTKLGITPQK